MKLIQLSLFTCVALCLFQTPGISQQVGNQQNQQDQFSNEQARNQQLYLEQQQRAQEAAQRQQMNLGVQQARGPARPFPELDQQHRQYIDQLLDIWQQSSAQVKQYTCDFQRWDYDPTYCNYREPNTNRLAAFSIAQGAVRFAAPDKGMFETSKVWDFNGEPDQPGGNAKYKEREQSTNHEKWICDGGSIYEFDFANKVLYEVEIPAEMQGNGLANSPLPFLFGVEKDVIKERYWLRVITPQGVEDEYWLEAFPKRIDDARNYKKIEIILAKEDFLPKMLHIYATNYDEVENPISRVFEFGNRQMNSKLAQVQNFLRVFVRPQTPIGWRRMDRNALATQDQQPPIVGQNPNQNQNGQPRR